MSKSVSRRILGPDTKYLGRFLTRAPVSKSAISCVGCMVCELRASCKYFFEFLVSSPAACIRSSPFSVCLSSLVRRKTRGNRLQFDAGEQRTLRFSFGAVSTLRRPWNISLFLSPSFSLWIIREYDTFRRSRFRSFRYFWCDEIPPIFWFWFR